MFGRDGQDGATAPPVTELVAAPLEVDITEVSQSVDAYLANPSQRAHDELVASLGSLDDQTAAADAYHGRMRRWALTKSQAVGASSDVDACGPVPVAEFEAQAALVRAAKEQLRDPSPANRAALEAAAGALRGLGAD